MLRMGHMPLKKQVMNMKRRITKWQLVRNSKLFITMVNQMV